MENLCGFTDFMKRCIKRSGAERPEDLLVCCPINDIQMNEGISVFLSVPYDRNFPLVICGTAH